METPCQSDAGYGNSRHLQIKACRLATAIFAGEYRSAFRGRGIEFDQVREYQPGDDVRSIDWNVTARLGRPFVKRFVEERELTVVMVLDRSRSMQFGTTRCSKLETAAEATGLLAFAALRSHDKTALLSTGDGLLRYLRPGKGKRHTLRLLQESLEPDLPGEKSAGLESSLSYLDRVLKGRCVVCIFSDFLDGVPGTPLASLASRHDVVAVAIDDPAELQIPECGLLTLRDSETGASYRIDSSDRSVRRAYRDQAARKREQRRRDLLRFGADYLQLGTEVPPLHALTVFFQERRQRRSA